MQIFGYNIFRTGVRLAFLPAVVAGLIFFCHAFFLKGFLWISLLQGVVFAFLIFVTGYLLSAFLLKKRIAEIRSVLQGCLKDKTNYPEWPKDVSEDELGLVLKESQEIKAAVHKEFQRLKEIENYRKEFIGNISHELKTPIFSVQGYLETLQSGALDDTEVNYRFLTKAMKNVERLSNLTEDLMEISKLESGELKPNPELIPLNNLIREVMESLSGIAHQREVKLIFEQKEANIFIEMDRNQIRQVLINLIENGIKYNEPKGSVYISASRSEEYPGKILVLVRDTGIGLSPKEIERVTERFFRTDKSRSMDQEGTGLGLSIVKHILESNKEKFFIESEPEKGSTFGFTVKKY